MRKPGYLTSEFWLVFTTLTLTNLGALPVPEGQRWIVTLGGIVGYALARAIAKVGGPSIEAEQLPVHPADVASGQAQKRELAKDAKRAQGDRAGRR